MNRLVFGAGKVGIQLTRVDTQLIPHKVCDIRDVDQVTQIIRNFKPKTVINCAAKTNLGTLVFDSY